MDSRNEKATGSRHPMASELKGNTTAPDDTPSIRTKARCRSAVAHNASHRPVNLGAGLMSALDALYGGRRRL